MVRLLIFGFCLSWALSAGAQSYLDLFQLNYSSSPDAGLYRRKQESNSHQWVQVKLSLPLIFKKDSSVLIFNPFMEARQIVLQQQDLPKWVQSYAFQVNYVKPLSDQWSLTTVLIPRYNGYQSKVFSHSFQMGGAMIADFRKNSNVTYRFGVYYNSEFSGPFIMPLAGIDWQIDRKNNLCGLLPGNLTFEHRVNRRLYYGLAFRAITNSYQAGFLGYSLNRRFLRIDDNQLGFFADLYLSPKWVLNLEAGHSVLRRLRLGIENGMEKYYEKAPVNDDLYLRTGIAYRLRFR